MHLVSVTQQRAKTACVRAKELELVGDYQTAFLGLQEFWRGPGSEPQIQGVEEETAAELLLRAGSISCRLGGASRIEGLQEAAKDLLTRATERFERLRQPAKVLECRNALAICYWMSGSFDEARTVLREALLLEAPTSDAKLTLMITLGLVEREAGRLHEALRIYAECAPLAAGTESDYLRGSFHMNFALALRSAGELDRALIESTAATYYLQQAGHLRYQARVLNNIAMLLMNAGRFEEAHENLDHAESLFKRLADRGSLAWASDTRAQIFLAERRHTDAEKAAAGAVNALRESDEKALLADALVTLGTAQARKGTTVAAILTFADAAEIAQQFVNQQTAAQVTVKLIEELVGPAYLLSGLTYEVATDRLEARIIKEALDQSDGRITEASLRLGLSHQALSWMLNNQHSALQDSRRPIRRRHVSIMTKKSKPKVVKMPGKD